MNKLLVSLMSGIVLSFNAEPSSVAAERYTEDQVRKLAQEAILENPDIIQWSIIAKLKADISPPEIDRHIRLAMRLAQMLHNTVTPAFFVRSGILVDSSRLMAKEAWF